METIESAEQLPADFRKLVIAGAKILFKRYYFGIVFSQKIITHNNMFWLHIFQISEEVYLVPKATDLLISIHYMLKGTIAGTMNGRPFVLKENTYQLYALAEEVGYLVKLQEGYYISFHTTVPPDTIPQMLETYTDDTNLKELIERGFQGNFYDYLFTISRQIKKNINTILDNKRATTLKDKLARDVVWEANLLALFSSYIEDKNNFHKHQEWMVKAHVKLSELRQYVNDNILDNDHSDFKPLKQSNVLKKISLKNEDFKKAMVDKYGKSWKEFVQEIKMEKAALLLISQSEQPVSAIAASLGYSVPTHFSRAFKKHFALSPAEYRKDKT